MRNRAIEALAKMIAGDEEYFLYRKGWQLPRFFEDCGHQCDFSGSRVPWTEEQLRIILNDPRPHPTALPGRFVAVIRNLMLKEDADDNDQCREVALVKLNKALKPEGFEAIYADDGECHLRHIKSDALSGIISAAKRAFTASERETQSLLERYLKVCSEDDLIERILAPLFRSLGFERIQTPGHRDKALEYGKDMWMKFELPTRHSIYFAVQAKKGNIDAKGKTLADNVNCAELIKQAKMALGHPVSDPGTNRTVLVDHVYIVAGGEVSKQARNFIVGALDAESRRHLIFMDRSDLLELFPTSGVPLPPEAVPAPLTALDDWDDDVPF